MLKRDELNDPNSCLNKAADDEPIFVLLGRDHSAPATILKWICERILSGENAATDKKIAEALGMVNKMLAYRGNGDG